MSFGYFFLSIFNLFIIESIELVFKLKEYDIILQGDIKNRREPSNLNKVYVRSKNTNKLISISNLVSLEEEGDAPFLIRYDRQKAVTISANISGDYTLAQALNFLEKIVNIII